MEAVTPTTVELHVICDVWTQNTNDRINRFQRAELISAARWAGKIEAMRAKIPRLGRVSIKAQPMQARGTLADPGAHLPAVKAIVDGLRDAKVIDDDTDEFVTNIDMLPAVRTTARAAGVVLYLTPIALHL